MHWRLSRAFPKRANRFSVEIRVFSNNETFLPVHLEWFTYSAFNEIGVSERALSSCFIAFSHAKRVSTFAENALEWQRLRLYGQNGVLNKVTVSCRRQQDRRFFQNGPPVKVRGAGSTTTVPKRCTSRIANPRCESPPLRSRNRPSTPEKPLSRVRRSTV